MFNQEQVKVRRNFLRYIAAGLIALSGAAAYFIFQTVGQRSTSVPSTTSKKKFLLPIPKFSSKVMVEEAIAWRRSIREYKDEPITIENLSMLLWAAQGITEFRYGFRTVPSAGGTYPLDIYVVIADNGVIITESDYLPGGSYKYNCKDHSIELISSGNIREGLAKASLNQEWVKKAVINIVVFATYERTTEHYGDRGKQYVHMEDGHVGQNIYLMAAALKLGTVVIGAFDDVQVRVAVGASEKEQPLYVVPVSVPIEPNIISENELSEYYEKVRQVE